jgi:membrane protease subunit (stomatin/prohibitin family)
VVKNMVYCSNCGAKIDDDAYFCPKCGTKTPKGNAANAAYPSDELRDAFYQVGIELEKAFTMAARETQAAFKKASKNMQQKPAAKTEDTVACPKCATKNLPDSIFCNNCGTRITPSEEPHGST